MKNTFINDFIEIDERSATCSHAATCPDEALKCNAPDSQACQLPQGILATDCRQSSVSLPAVLDVLASDCPLDGALSDILAQFEISLAIDWILVDVTKMSQSEAQARALLQDVANAHVGNTVPERGQDLQALEAWVRYGADQHYSQMHRHHMTIRLKLIALLFGPATLAELLQDDLRSGLQRGENYVTCGIKVFSELHYLEVLDSEKACMVASLIQDDKFNPQGLNCHSACAEALGVLLPPLVRCCRASTSEVEKSIKLIIDTASYWINGVSWRRLQKTRGEIALCLHQCLWALNQIFACDHSLAMCCATDCSAITDVVLGDPYFEKFKDAEWEGWDEHEILRNASKLRSVVVGPRSC